MANNTEWTYQKLTSEMRKLGWRACGQGVYSAEAGDRVVKIGLFSLDTSGERPRELWHRYAEANAAPRPEDFC